MVMKVKRDIIEGIKFNRYKINTAIYLNIISLKHIACQCNIHLLISGVVTYDITLYCTFPLRRDDNDLGQ